MPEKIEVNTQDINDSFSIFVYWPIPGDNNYAPVTTNAIKNLFARSIKLKNSLNDLEINVNNLNTGFTGLQSALNTLQTTVNGIQTTVNGLQVIVTGLQTSVTDLQTDVENFMTNVEGDIISLYNLISNLSSNSNSISFNDAETVFYRKVIHFYNNFSEITSKPSYPNTYPGQIIKSRIRIGNNKDVSGIHSTGVWWAYDMMDYTPNTPVNNLNGGDGWITPWVTSSISASTQPPGADIPNAIELGSVHISTNDWIEIKRTLKFRPGNVIWLCFMAQFVADWSHIALKDNPTLEKFRIMKTDNTNGEIVLAGPFPANSTGNSFWVTKSVSNVATSFNLFVIKVDQINKKLDLYINPDTELDESSLPSPDITIQDSVNSSVVNDISFDTISLIGDLKIDEVRFATSYNALWTNPNNINTANPKLLQISFRSEDNGFQHGSIEVESDDQCGTNPYDLNFRIVGPVQKTGKINFLLSKGNYYKASNLSNILDNSDNAVASMFSVGDSTPSMEMPGLLNIIPLSTSPNDPQNANIPNNTIAIYNNSIYIKLNGNWYSFNLTPYP